MGKNITITEKEKIELGIDEAGRGCVVGDMYIAGICLPISIKNLFRDVGVKDSKLLTPQQREKIFNIIVSRVPLALWTIIPSTLIDEENINELFINGVSLIVRRALSYFGSLLTKIVIDLTGNKSKIIDRIRDIGFRGEIIIEHKADAKYVSVGAASILAKVLRDKHIRLLEEKYGYIGSGYPSDPKTLFWIKKMVSEKSMLPSIVRRTWSTIKKIAPEYYKEKRRKTTGRQRSLLEYINCK